MMPIIESTDKKGINWKVAFGNNGKRKRKNPYVPIFKRTPARMTEPAVGAYTCASGSQVWKGNIGTLMAKAKANAKKSQICSESGRPRL